MSWSRAHVRWQVYRHRLVSSVAMSSRQAEVFVALLSGIWLDGAPQNQVIVRITVCWAFSQAHTLKRSSQRAYPASAHAGACTLACTVDALCRVTLCTRPPGQGRLPRLERRHTPQCNRAEDRPESCKGRPPRRTVLQTRHRAETQPASLLLTTR